MKAHIGPYPADEDTPRTFNIEVEPHDTWSLDVTFAHLAVPLLKQLRDTTHGYPSEFAEDDDHLGERGFAKWVGILNQMIEAFELVIDHAEGRDPTGPDFSTAYKAREEKIQHGLNLFAKYYRDLWD